MTNQLLIYNEYNCMVKKKNKLKLITGQVKEKDIWRPPSLSELTPYKI